MGFNWLGGKWVSQTFTQSQFIVKKMSDPDDGALAGFCFPWAARENAASQATDRQSACYAQFDLGSEPSVFDVYRCTEHRDSEGKVVFVDCGASAIAFRLQPNGEFSLTWTYSINDAITPGDEYRDSMVLRVGKCSVID